MTHMRAYPKNPGLESDTGIPKDGNQFVKMLFNAKTQAEEEYRNGPREFKPVIYESQIDQMRGFYEDQEKFTGIDTWLRESWEVIDDRTPEKDRARQESWDRINKMLDDQYYKRINLHHIAPQGRGKTWLGSQIAERERERLQRGNRVEKVHEVPSIRGFGYSTDQAYIDEPHRLSVRHHGYTNWGAREEGDATLGAWLQRRGICYRASSCSMA